MFQTQPIDQEFRPIAFTDSNPIPVVQRRNILINPQQPDPAQQDPTQDQDLTTPAIAL
jgi:hypothetical protein